MTNNMITAPANETMNSVELFTVINVHRVAAGKKPMKHHRELVRKINDELDTDLGMHKKIHTSVPMPRGGFKTMDSYELTREEVILVSMRESKQVRKSIYNYIVALEKENAKLKDALMDKWLNYTSTSPREVCGMLSCEHTMVFLNMIKTDFKVQAHLLAKGYLKHKSYGEAFQQALYETTGKPITTSLKFTVAGKHWFKDNIDTINQRLALRKANK